MVSDTRSAHSRSMSLRGRLCFALSRPALRKPVADVTASKADYQEWRKASLGSSWRHFSNALINGKDVLDFGCGNGPLSIFLATTCTPASLTGVDLYAEDLARAERAFGALSPRPSCDVRFIQGHAEGIPLPDASVDTVLAFDCLEHVMDPVAILREWCRVLRSGGSVLIEWFPFAGPYGPHMEALIPIPWAQYLFGQRAMFEAAERLYDDPLFQPRHWDLDARGARLPNKWRQWRSFAEQAYVNELSTSRFVEMTRQVGLSITRFERHGLFSTRPVLAPFTRALAAIPGIGECLTSHVIMELTKR